jgi:AhpD family alkylhydroperoxidase
MTPPAWRVLAHVGELQPITAKLRLRVSQRNVNFIERDRARPVRDLLLAWFRETGSTRSLWNAALLQARCRPATRHHDNAESSLKPRLDLTTTAPTVFKAMLALQASSDQCHLEPALLELVKMRASQINGCAYCLDMHAKDARAQGETEQRLYVLSAWREAPFFSEREREALAWTETLTQIADNPVSDGAYLSALKHFTEEELVELSLAIVAINGWNRLTTAFRSPVGTYQPPARARSAPQPVANRPSA